MGIADNIVHASPSGEIAPIGTVILSFPSPKYPTTSPDVASSEFTNKVMSFIFGKTLCACLTIILNAYTNESLTSKYAPSSVGRRCLLSFSPIVGAIVHHRFRRDRGPPLDVLLADDGNGDDFGGGAGEAVDDLDFDFVLAGGEIELGGEIT